MDPVATLVVQPLYLHNVGMLDGFPVHMYTYMYNVMCYVNMTCIHVHVHVAMLRIRSLALEEVFSIARCAIL